MRVRGRPRYWILAGAVLALYTVALVALFGRFDRIGVLTIVNIDSYPPRTKVTGCADPLVGRAGVREFQTLILTQVGGGDDGLALCKKIANGSGSFSDHADGRAWDWHVKASNKSDQAKVSRVLNWLLRTDELGNRNAMARRLGITYIIWNHQIYRVSSDTSQWSPYTSTGDPHDTHVHFSFSVSGAFRQTSWWSERGPLVWSLSDSTDIALTFGSGPLRPLAGDWNGDGRDTVGVYNTADRRFSMRDAITTGDPDVTTSPIGPFGAIPLAGDWDGKGGDEVGIYDPLARRFDFYSTSGKMARPSQAFGAAGDLPIVGDWDGDGADDVGAYTPGSAFVSLLLPDGSVRTEAFGEANDTPVVGDWNGDGRDDIGAFRSSKGTFHLTAPAAHGSQPSRSVNHTASRHLPVSGDWDGNGTDSEGLVTAA